MESSFDTFLSVTPTTAELTKHIDVSTNWYIVGTMLDLDQKRLRSIEAQTGHTDTHKMIKMFNLWLTTTPTASRRQVLETLRIRVVGENTLADEYEKHLKDLHEATYTPPSTEAVSILQKNIQSLNEALVSPVQVSQLLYSKRCISEATLDEMEKIDQGRSLDDKKTTLLTAMKETVSSDHRKLKDIATVLSDVEKTRDIGKEMVTKYEENMGVSAEVQRQKVVGSNEDCASDILRNNYSALSLSITEPVRMARLLHEEVISDEALSRVISTRGSVSDSRAVLLKAVRDAVHSNYKHLELFVTVLRKFSETAHIGDTIFEEYCQLFCENVNTIEEVETYLKEGRSLKDATSVESGSACGSFEEVKWILSSHKILFPHSMKEKIEELRIKFGSTFFKVRGNFAKDKNLSIDEMKLLVSDCFPDLSSQVFNKKTINEVLDVVKTRCNIINILPLEVLASEFNIKKAKKVIKGYKEFARDFCKSTSIELCLDQELQAVPTPSHLKKETVTFILEWSPNDTTLQDINDVLQKLEPLKNYFIQVDTIKTGQSVVVTCYCPAEYTGSLIMAVLEKIEILQKRGLKEFIIGNCTIWNNTAYEVLVSSTMATKEVEQPTIMTVNNYKERELLFMRQQFVKQMEELQMKLGTRKEEDHTHILPKESIDELNEKLETQYAINRRKTMEIEDLQAIMREKDEKMIDTEKELASLKKLSENKQQEIEQLKLELEDKNRQKDGTVIWGSDHVYLTSPSVAQCKEVICKLENKHDIMALSASSSHSTQYLIPTILQSTTIKKLVMYSFFLTPDDILSFSSQLSTNKSLMILCLINGSIKDDGVIVLAKSLQLNETLRELYLTGNPDITSASAQSLAQLLRNNKTLSNLYLYDTNIEYDGVEILLKSLTNSTLETLWLDKQLKETCLTLIEDMNIIQFW
ncbi:PREDICTED: uncharacterized protein LOC109588730 [Amphimedon queenslandica]|uniref:Death domain-containing protein n=1 Tax=Amphimedon queenslandica TaxID=400682 RepID=A0A1X7TBY7_AMPQE|nr:PREDICTED: uncharacterized protein LOC109588730 [Amphimedon queenslandica]|eukprot:XP_019860406.1 PREDICTED: uncharacterized protein LOC109588730 [Amphimedon queenslandica]